METLRIAVSIACNRALSSTGPTLTCPLSGVGPFKEGLLFTPVMDDTELL